MLTLVLAEVILLSSIGKGLERVQFPQWHPLKMDG
jgi:hypothetical protein